MKYSNAFFGGIFLGVIFFVLMLKTSVISEDKVFGTSVEIAGIIPTSTLKVMLISTPTLIPIPTPTLFPLPTFTPTPSLTPTLTPIPTPIVAPIHLGYLFRQYAAHYGIEEQLLTRIAWCESRFDPAAVNGSYVGLYQFTEERWITHRTAMGHDINPELRVNAEESIKTAAYLISLGKLFMWPNCAN